MSLGTGAYKVGREPEQIQAQQGGFRWEPHEWEPALQNPMSGGQPYMKQATGIVTLRTSPPYKWGRVAAGIYKDLLNLHCQKNPQQAKITCKNSKGHLHLRRKLLTELAWDRLCLNYS